jgi:xanthine/CO dehydrogenase XdhC/CoxF family maturation factor
MVMPDLAGSIELLAERNVLFALATVVAVRGSAYRRPGARAVLPVGGDPIGSLSPGCLESELVEDARSVAETGTPALREFDLTGEDEVELGYGMGCQGVVEVFLEPASTAAEFAGQVRAVQRQRQSRALVTILEGEAAGSRVTLTRDGNVDYLGPVYGAVTPGAIASLRAAFEGYAPNLASLPTEERAFRELLQPPIRLALFGDRSDAQALADAARALGWEVACVSRSEPVPDDLLDERTFAVVMNHAYVTDGERLRMLLDSSVPYIGMLGPRGRTERLLAEVNGHPGLERVFAPAGLDLGAEGPQEIASAIVAEIIAVDRGRGGGSLRERHAPIHGEG